MIFKPHGTRRWLRAFVLHSLLFLFTGCSDVPSSPSKHSGQSEPSIQEAFVGGIAPGKRVTAWLAALRRDRHFVRGGWRLLVGAGDIARCNAPDDPTTITPPELTAAESTAILLNRIPGTVMALGDNAYEFGSPADYALCYDPTWGRHKRRTRPAAGNHEYLTPGAAGYFGYFGLAATPPGGYYSYDLGSWHIIVLNSTAQWAACPPTKTSPDDGRTCLGDPAQRAWLSLDLAAHPRRCTLAYFHHPRFSSGLHGSQYEMQQFWDMLYAGEVDVIVSAHDHVYERFAPQDPDGNPDPKRGIRQFTAGTGGAELYPFTTVLANSEARNNATHGVLALALGNGRYRWMFVPASGANFADAGVGSCH